MKWNSGKALKLLLSVFILATFFVMYGCNVYKSSFGEWEVNRANESEINWVSFLWTNQIKNGKLYERTAMLIPCRIDGIKNDLTLQFDIGSKSTMLYENSLSSFYFQNRTLSDRLSNFKFPVSLAVKRKLFDNLNISFGTYQVYNTSSLVLNNYGNKTTPEAIIKGDTIHIGTLGADIFQDKVLIIDYPKQRFAITENVPEAFNNRSLISIEIDKNGKPVLPLILNSKKYRILFDNGSSLFPLITASENLSKFSQGPILDSIEVSSWGEKHFVDSRMITDTFSLGGKKFSNVKVYSNHSGLGIDKRTDGMAGNYLFWHNTIIVDFKNKKFGVY